MKLLLRAVLLAALLALAWWLWTVFFPSPEKAIRKRLAALAQAASFKSNEGDLERFGNVAQLGGFFTPDAQVTLDIGGYGGHTFNGREEIMHVAAAGRQTVGSLQVEFVDPVIMLDADGQSATVNLTLRGQTPSDRNYVVEEMKLNLKKTDGRWHVARVESVKTLR